MSKVDAYNPDYYASMSVQPIMVMHACLTKEEFIGYLRGCLIKYQMRRGRKEDVEDTDKKILRYKKWLKELLDRVIDLGGYINPEDPVYFINEKGKDVQILSSFSLSNGQGLVRNGIYFVVKEVEDVTNTKNKETV